MEQNLRWFRRRPGAFTCSANGWQLRLIGYSMSADIDATENEGQHDNWVIRVDATGTILWERSFGFSGHDHA